MPKQIVRISVHQTSKVIAAMHAAIITVLFILPIVLGHWFHGDILLGILILVLLPLVIWLFMYISYVIACWFYNLVVPWTGGIEVEVADVKEKIGPEVIVKEEVGPEVIVKNSEKDVIHPDRIDELSKGER